MKEQNTNENVNEGHNKEFKHIVRISNTDLDGNKNILAALRAIKGVSFMFANAVCKVSGVDVNKKTGLLSDDEISKLEEVLKNPKKYGIPTWLFNRRKDLETGEDMHLLAVDLDVKLTEDLRRMKKIRSYRGVRHMFGLPVRGQRTRSNFRKNKGKVIGVVKKAAKAAKK